MLQEVKLKGDKYWRMVSKCKHDQRMIFCSQAIHGLKNGLSSGVAIMVDKSRDTDVPDHGKPIEHGEEHLHYEIVPGRAAAVVIQGWAHTTLLMITLYLDVDDGLQETNISILYIVGEWIARMGIPYVICGDFNNHVKDIQWSLVGVQRW